MGGPTILLQRPSGGADTHSGASRVRMAKPADAKKSKRPGSFRDGAPPAKRVRAACSDRDPNLAAAKIKNKKRPSPPCIENSKSSASAIKNQAIASQIQLPNQVVKPQSKHSISSSSISDLIEKARLAKARPSPSPSTAEAEPLDPREIERRRAVARRELEKMVATVEFNDPFIDPLDVTRSGPELIQARQQAWRAQLLAVARPPPAEAMRQPDIERCRAEPKQGVVCRLILT